MGPCTSALQIPTDYEQATGIERYQLLGNMAGVDVFDMAPVEVTRMGTLVDPIKVNSVVRPPFLILLSLACMLFQGFEEVTRRLWEDDGGRQVGSRGRLLIGVERRAEGGGVTSKPSRGRTTRPRNPKLTHPPPTFFLAASRLTSESSAAPVSPSTRTSSSGSRFRARRLPDVTSADAAVRLFPSFSFCPLSFAQVQARVTDKPCFALDGNLADKLAYHNPWAAVIPEIAEQAKTHKLVSAHAHH